MRSFSRGTTAAALSGAAALFLAGCAGPSSASKKAVNGFIAQGDYAAAESYIGSKKLTEYSKKNQVLFYLDMGMVQHHAGKYKESDLSFDRAESRMEELYTKSITKSGGMILLNDNTVDYAGEPFERALTNVFRALNYVFLGRPDEALVESRKVETFLDELNRRTGKKSVYKDDAFARYLDGLLYADQGKNDDARISMEAADAAYQWYASDYHVQPPKFDLDEGKGLGEVVFFHYNGTAPRKISKSFQFAWNEVAPLLSASKDDEAEDARVTNALKAGFVGKAVTVAFPEYVQDPFSIIDSAVYVGEKKRASTVLMEDISAIAFKNLADRNALIKTRAIARAAVKYILAETASRAAEKKFEKDYGKGTWQSQLLGGISRGLAHGTAAATEVADTRGWAALPSQIRMARVLVPPGKHDIRVEFKNSAGGVVATHVFKQVVVKKSRRTYLSYRTAL
jgi:uncharacterized protein